MRQHYSSLSKDIILQFYLQVFGTLVFPFQAVILNRLPVPNVGFVCSSGLPPNKVVPRLKQKVTSFKQGVPVITSLRNPSLRLRHWEAIQNLIGTRIVRDKYFTLGNLLQLKVYTHVSSSSLNLLAGFKKKRFTVLDKILRQRRGGCKETMGLISCSSITT